MSRVDALTVARRLTHAIVTGNADVLASLYTPNAIIWHNTDQIEMSSSEVLDLVRAIRAVANCAVDVSSTLVTERGFVQTQRNTYTFRDGRSTFFHAALLATLDGEGRILRLEEYLDSAGLAPLLAALQS
jgi:uncharacterized protein